MFHKSNSLTWQGTEIRLLSLPLFPLARDNDGNFSIIPKYKICSLNNLRVRGMSQQNGAMTEILSQNTKICSLNNLRVCGMSR